MTDTTKAPLTPLQFHRTHCHFCDGDSLCRDGQELSALPLLIDAQRCQQAALILSESKEEDVCEQIREEWQNRVEAFRGLPERDNFGTYEDAFEDAMWALAYRLGSDALAVARGEEVTPL